MKYLFGQNGNFYHHTLLIRSLVTIDEIKTQVFDLINPQEVTFSILDEEKLTVDHVREIQEMTYRKNPTKYTVYIIRVAGTSPQSQNGLLKIIEEPPAGTYFIFATTEPTILPTFLSRSHEITFDILEDLIISPEKFYKKKIPARLEEVTGILAEYKKGRVNKQQIMRFLGALSEFLITQGKKEDAARIFEMMKTLTISSGSLKQVLEGVSVMV